MMELMKQVGDLARRILTVEHYYLPDREQDSLPNRSGEAL